MILMPYTVTALAESDAQGTDGKNIVENAIITLESLAGASITMYDDINATNPATTKYTNADGYKIIWIESGTYKLYVNNSLSYIEAALDSRPYGIAVEGGITWPNGTDLTDFTGVLPWVNYTLDFSLPYTGAGLPPGLDSDDLNAALIYEGNLNGFGIFRLSDVATGAVWVKTWNNQTTQVDWQQIGAQITVQQTTDIAVHDAMFSWWTAPKTIRYTDESRDWTLQSFNQSNGAVGVFIHNHKNRNTGKYVLDSDRTPDDHNAGCITVGDGKVVAVYGGRSNTVAPVNECLVCEWDIDLEPNPGNVTKYYLAAGRDYPVMFQYDDDAILIVSQRGGAIPVSDPSYQDPVTTNPSNTWRTGHAFMTNSWPLGSGSGSWSAKTPLTNYVIDDINEMPEWMYMTARRNYDDPSIIDMIWGFHPNPANQPIANIYKSQIRHVAGVNPWRLYVNGVEIANLSSGVGLPVTLSQLELAYTAGGSERTRLYDVRGNDFVFTSYTGSDTANSVYKYGYKSGASWLSSTVANCGEPFYAGDSFYFGGASIKESTGANVITIAQNVSNTVSIIDPDDSTSNIVVSGDWRFVDLLTTDGGASWAELQEYKYSGNNKGGLIHGRPIAEHASLKNIEDNSTAGYQVMGWVGQYSINSFNDFASAAVSISPKPKEFTNKSWQYNGINASSADCTMEGDKQACIASESSILSERERMAAVASSDVQMTTRNSFAGGARRVKFTGTDDGSGVTDTWLMGVVGVNKSTIAKNYSFMGGCNEVTFTEADSDGNRCNGAVGAENCGADSGSSFVSFIASKDCGDNDGDYSIYAASTGCIVDQSSPANTGRSAFIASLGNGDGSTATTGKNTESRTYQIGANGCISSGTGSGLLSSTGTATVFGENSIILSANGSTNNGDKSLILSDESSILNGDNSVLIGATRTRLDTNNAIAGGYNASGSALTTNRTWQINSTTGDMFISGTLAQSHTFADIAKMIKNGESSEIGPGYLLTLIADKVYKSRSGDPVDAIVAATPSSIHNDTPFHWQGRHLTDDFGRVLKESKEFVKWGSFNEIYQADKKYPTSAKIHTEEKDGIIEKIISLDGYDGLVENAPELPEWAIKYTMDIPIENPSYDPELDNVKRSDRPDDWTVAGINGFIRTRVDNSITQVMVDTHESLRANVYIKPGNVNGVGTLSVSKTNVQVMRVEKEYNNDYGVALCYFKGSD